MKAQSFQKSTTHGTLQSDLMVKSNKGNKVTLIECITLYKSINISFLFQMCHVFCAQCILTNFTHISFSRQCNSFYISNWTSLRQFLTLYLLIFKSSGKLQRFHCVSIKVTSPSEPQNFNNKRQLTVKESDSHTYIQNVNCNGTKSSKH